MDPKETIMAWVALLAILAGTFVSMRNEMREVTIQLTKIQGNVEMLHEFCCGEIKYGNQTTKSREEK